LFEIGSQLRRSSNSAPANLAEGFNNKHINFTWRGLVGLKEKYAKQFII
jgi:four helix bundle protein